MNSNKKTMSTRGSLRLASLTITGVLAAFLAACGGGGGSNPQTGAVANPSASTATLTGVTAPTPARYGQASTFVLAGTKLDQAGVPTASGCTGLSVQTQTSTAITLSCVPVSLTPSFTLANQASIAATVPTPQVTFATSMGDIVVALSPTQAPITVQNFLWYVNSGYYNQTLIHRITTLASAGIAVVQGGGFKAVDPVNGTLVAQTAESRPAIALESNVGLHNTAGTIAMARANAANSATSQFFFNAADNAAALDYKSSANPGYAVFGSVITGSQVITAMNAVATRTVGAYLGVPSTDIVIQSVTQTQ